MPLSESEELELLELEEQEAQTSAPVEEKEPSMSMSEAAIRGGAQGIPFVGSYSDELAGGLESAAGSLGLVPDKTYQQARDESRAAFRTAQEERPASFYGGMLATSAPLDVAKAVPGLGQAVGAVEGGIYGLGASEADLLKGEYGKAAFDTSLGATVGAVAPKVVSAIGKSARAIPKGLGWAAEKLAENSTGATGKQVQQFADDAGRQLLDRGLVRFGDSPGNIATRTAAAMKGSTQVLDDALKFLDDQGVEVSVDNVVSELERRISVMRGKPENAGLIRQLENEIQNIVGAGQSRVPVSAAEMTKRGYQGKVNWLTPDSNQVNREVSGVYKEAVEGAAEAADPAVASAFKEAKQTYGLLSPIQEAAEKRAATLGQQQVGGLLDLAAGAYGLSSSDSVSGKAALAFAGRRFVAPRIASSAAVSIDKLSKALQASPQIFGKYAQPLVDAMKRGGAALTATHFTLMSQEPEYRQSVQQYQNQDQPKE